MNSKFERIAISYQNNKHAVKRHFRDVVIPVLQHFYEVENIN